MELYHGSGEIILSPEIRDSKYTKDFGPGFYCTALEEQAKRWAWRKNNPEKGWVPTVNVYNYEKKIELKCLIFAEMTEEWLDFIAACRSGVPHNYDIVEGPMADDQIWNYVEDFLSGAITRKAFWALAEFARPTHQISFHSESALNCLTFKKAVNV